VCRCRLSSRRVYFPIDWRPPRDQKASGNVGQAGAGNICRLVAAGGRGRLILCSRRLPLADALPHSLRPRRGPLRSLLPIGRSEFLSVDGGPRDNRPAGACRSRHRGGRGRGERRARLKGGCCGRTSGLYYNYACDTNSHCLGRSFSFPKNMSISSFSGNASSSNYHHPRARLSFPFIFIGLLDLSYILMYVPKRI